MKKLIKILGIILLLFKQAYALDFSSIDIPSVDEVESGLSSVGNSAVGVLGGFAQGFGYCPTNRKYNMKIYNDTPSPLYGVIQNITGFLGASLTGIPIAATLINPLTNTGNGLKNLSGVCAGKVYLSPTTNDTTITNQTFTGLIESAKQGSLSLGNAGGTALYVASDILDIFTTLIGSLEGETEILDAMLANFAFYQRPFDTVADDTSTYFYHAYYNKRKNFGEFLNADLATSTDFSGVFYNSSSNDVKLTYQKDDKNYTVTLEKNSFNVLNSTPGITNSIRPPTSDDTKDYTDRRSFTFTLNNKTTSIPISSTGLADNILDSNGNIIDTIAKIYTYEIFDVNNEQEVGIQGLQIGNYDQLGVVSEESKTAIIATLPSDITKRASVIAGLAKDTSFYSYPLLKNLRNINPINASIWFQSADTALKKSLTTNPSFDYSAIPYNLPQTLWVYYKEKDSNTILQKIKPGDLLNLEFFRPTVSENITYLYIFALDTSNESKAQQFFENLFVTARPQQYFTQINDPLNIPEISAMKPDTNGKVYDSKSGVTGWFLLEDIFTRTGIGSGPFYYSIAPSYLILSQFSSAISAYIDTSVYTDTTSLNKALMEPLISWLSYYQQNKDSIEALNINDATSSSLPSAIPDLTSYLQTNGTDATKSNINSALYSIMYGPTSITKPPLYMQGGTNNFTTMPTGWPNI